MMLALRLLSAVIPLRTSVQLAVPVLSKGLWSTTPARGAIPITPSPSCAATISPATLAPWPSTLSLWPVERITRSERSATPPNWASRMPMMVSAPLPCCCVTAGVQLAVTIQ